jgi:nucleoside-diphosphate-sugar epimerase
MASYLVTGGAGFIGSHLTEELVRRGHHVRVADSLITGKRRNLDHVPGIELLEGDLADRSFATPASGVSSMPVPRPRNVVDGAGHTFRPPAAQRALRRLLIDFVESPLP